MASSSGDVDRWTLHTLINLPVVGRRVRLGLDSTQVVRLDHDPHPPRGNAAIAEVELILVVLRMPRRSIPIDAENDVVDNGHVITTAVVGFDEQLLARLHDRQLYRHTLTSAR